MIPNIRVAKQADLAAVQAIDSECFPKGLLELEPAAPGEIEGGIVSGCILVAESDGQIVGFLQYRVDSPAEIELLSLGITGPMRSQQLGSKLMQRFFELVEYFPHQRVSCFTAPTNLSMQRLLEKFGFRNQGIKDNHFGPGKHRLRYLWRAIEV